MKQSSTNYLQQFDAWHKTRLGHGVMGGLELLIAYLLVSRAIDTGSWWEYLFTFIFLIGALQNLVRIFTVGNHGKK